MNAGPTDDSSETYFEGVAPLQSFVSQAIPIDPSQPPPVRLGRPVRGRPGEGSGNKPNEEMAGEPAEPKDQKDGTSNGGTGT